MEPGVIDDIDLVERAKGGDRRAMDDLLRRHYDRVYAVCRRVTGHDADAADAAQNALIAIVRSLSSFDGRASFGTWAYRIATNASLDELRRRRRRPVVSLTVEDDGTTLEAPVADPRSDAPIQRVVDRDALTSALATLPDDYRIPVVMRDVAALDYDEIATSLGIPLGTVKSRIARGRAALAAAYHRASGEQPPHGNQSSSSNRPTPAP